MCMFIVSMHIYIYIYLFIYLLIYVFYVHGILLPPMSTFIPLPGLLADAGRQRGQVLRNML